VIDISDFESHLKRAAKQKEITSNLGTSFRDKSHLLFQCRFNGVHLKRKCSEAILMPRHLTTFMLL